jgi:hypothetical protein
MPCADRNIVDNPEYTAYATTRLKMRRIAQDGVPTKYSESRKSDICRKVAAPSRAFVNMIIIIKIV